MSSIKETKEVMVFGISMAMAVDNITQDGFQWTDILSMVPPLTKLPAAISGIDQVPAEIDDLDEAERAELVQIINELDFDSDKSEAIAEQALRAGIELANLILIIRKSKE